MQEYKSEKRNISRRILPAIALAGVAAIALRNDQVQAQDTDKITKTVHLGSYTTDTTYHDKNEVKQVIGTIFEHIPSTTHIAISSHIDEPKSITTLTDEIHRYGKGVVFRSNGSYQWERHKGAKRTYSPDEQSKAMKKFFTDYSNAFTKGDIIEATPDEPENGLYWFEQSENKNKGIGASDKSLLEFNYFVLQSTLSIKNIFEKNNISGVRIGCVHMNPSALQNALFVGTSSVLDHVGADCYPEKDSKGKTLTDPTACATSLKNLIEDYLLSSPHAAANVPLGVTFGPGVTWQESNPGKPIPDTLVSNIYSSEFKVLEDLTDQIKHFTVYQAGDKENVFESRIFNFEKNQLKPRGGIPNAIEEGFKLLRAS